METKVPSMSLPDKAGETKSSGAGKGDRPRNCFGKKFLDNYDEINWNHKKTKEQLAQERRDKLAKKIADAMKEFAEPMTMEEAKKKLSGLIKKPLNKKE